MNAPKIRSKLKVTHLAPRPFIWRLYGMYRIRKMAKNHFIFYFQWEWIIFQSMPQTFVYSCWLSNKIINIIRPNISIGPICIWEALFVHFLFQLLQCNGTLFNYFCSTNQKTIVLTIVQCKETIIIQINSWDINEREGNQREPLFCR